MIMVLFLKNLTTSTLKNIDLISDIVIIKKIIKSKYKNKENMKINKNIE